MSRNSRKHSKKGTNLNNQRKKIIISLSVIIFLFATILLLVYLFNIIRGVIEKNKNIDNSSVNSNVISENNSKDDPKKEDVTFTLASIGDVMCHNTQYWDAYNKSTDEYNFDYVFDDINYYTKTADITVGSLETSFAGADRGYSNYPTFNSPDALAYSLKKIGVDVLSTAGNHSLDMGYNGLSRTIDVLDEADISHLGTYKSQEEQGKILYKYVKGVKIAFLNYTYGTNGIPVPTGKEYCVNLIDKDLIKKQIDTAKSQNAEVIIACMHWGTEYRLTANNEQKELSDFLFKNGVNIILGNHPHVLEPMEKRTVTLDDGSTKDGFVIYALGNFICDQNAENTRNSIILNLTITRRSDNKISIDKAEYTPIYMYKDPSLSIKKMKLLDIEKSIEKYESGTDTSIGQTLYNYLKVQLDKIKSIVGEEIT